MTDARAQLLADVEAFLKEFQMLPTQFGRRCLNDTAFVADLRGGRNVTLRTSDRVRRFMIQHRGRRKPRPKSGARCAALT